MQRQHDNCTVEGCDRPHKARGYCQTHYMQFQRGVPITAAIRHKAAARPDKCSEEGCGGAVKSNGLCGMHLQRVARHGSTAHRPRWKNSRGGCTYPGCERVRYSNDLCDKHYQKDRKWRAMGLSALEFYEQAKAQNFTCLICEQPEGTKSSVSNDPRELAVDHCHETNVIRGILCGNCNRALGLFGDDPEVVAKAATYLRRFKSG